MPLTVRLTPKTERALNALARHRRQTRSDVVREAIEHFTAGENGSGDESAYDRWADVLGIVRTRRHGAAKPTGQQFTDLVKQKARARRAR